MNTVLLFLPLRIMKVPFKDSNCTARSGTDGNSIHDLKEQNGQLKINKK